MNGDQYLSDLLYRAIRNQLTEEEQKELHKWLAKDKQHEALYKRLSSADYLLGKIEIYLLFSKDKAWKNLDQKLFTAKIINLDTRRFIRYAAAIALPLIIGSALYFYSTVFTNDQLANIDKIIAPGNQKATLILSDGKAVSFVENQDSSTIKQDQSVITNNHNALSYLASENDITQSSNLPLVYNELITPRGGAYMITLSDSTQVWLNSASALKFPISFTDSTRQVYLNGEAYFNVAHSDKPFIVTTDKMNISVLGTKFDLSSYPDEINTSATLVEGSIRYSTTEESNILVPGQQALLTQNKVIIRKVNTSHYTSWVNGKIEFNKENLESVMRILARSYDFDFVFKNEKAKRYHFTGRIDKSQNVSSVLKMLQMTADVTFVLEEKTIIIE